MSRRPVFAALAASLVLVSTAAACGSSGGPTGPVGAPPPRIGAIAIDPREGPIGTMFTLTATGLKEGEAVAFEITFPGEGKAFPGAALVVPADGTASTTYRATTANQPGEYQVRLTGPPGSLAEGRFTITTGPPLTSALPSDGGSSTTSQASPGRTATTSRSGRTTTTARGGSTTSTTARSSSTTATTAKVPTTATTVPNVTLPPR